LVLTETCSELVASNGGEADKEERVPAAEGVEVALEVDIRANSLSVDTLGVDQLVVLENHFFLFF
jgi:hypothetical protein